VAHMTGEAARGADVLRYPPGVFGSAHSKGLAGGLSVRADSKGLICTKIVQNSAFRVRAESKGVSLIGGVREGYPSSQHDGRYHTSIPVVKRILSDLIYGRFWETRTEARGNGERARRVGWMAGFGAFGADGGGSTHFCAGGGIVPVAGSVLGAPITTLVITQSSLGAALTVSWQRLVGTALGADSMCKELTPENCFVTCSWPLPPVSSKLQNVGSGNVPVYRDNLSRKVAANPSLNPPGREGLT
jgi:hypothetical protein